VQSFTVTLYDSGNNLVSKGGDQIEFSFTHALIEVFDNHDGTYLVEYLITQTGTYPFSITVNQDTVMINTITVVPNEPST
jgi:hypothetical protein